MSAFREYQHAVSTVADTAMTQDGRTLAVVPCNEMNEGADAKLYADGLTVDLLTSPRRFKVLKNFGRET